MEISTKLSECLQHLNLCSETELASTMATVTGLLRHGRDVVGTTASAQSTTATAVVFSVLGLLTRLESEAASAADARAVLERIGLSVEVVSALLALYSDTCTSLREARRGGGGSPFETLVDVEWRLDYLVQSRFQSGSAEMRALLALSGLGRQASSTDASDDHTGNGTNQFRFQCSRSELTDLLGKLREVERNVAGLCEDD